MSDYPGYFRSVFFPLKWSPCAVQVPRKNHILLLRYFKLQLLERLKQNKEEGGRIGINPSLQYSELYYNI